MAQPLGSPVFRGLDNNGAPLSLGTLESYVAGTSTPLATYPTAALGTANANPVVLDADGEAQVWLQDALYKFILKDSDGNIQWTVDNYPGGPTAAAGVDTYAPQVNYLDNGGAELDGDTFGMRTTVTANGASATCFTSRWWGYRGGQTGYAVTSHAGIDGLPGCFRLARTAANADVTPIVMGQRLEAAAVPALTQTFLIGRMLSDLASDQNYLIFSAYVKKGADFAGSGATIEIVSNTDATQNLLSGSGWTVEASATILANELSSSSYRRIACVKTGALTASTAALGWRVRYDTPAGTAGTDDYVQVTGMKAETNAVGAPTAYLIPTVAESRFRAMRFYRVFGFTHARMDVSAYGETGQNYDVPVQLSPPMAGGCTAMVNGTWTVSNCGQPTVHLANGLGFTLRTAVTSTGAFAFSATTGCTITLDCEV